MLDVQQHARAATWVHIRKLYDQTAVYTCCLQKPPPDFRIQKMREIEERLSKMQAAGKVCGAPIPSLWH